MLIVKEFLSALSSNAASGADNPPPKRKSQGEGSTWGAWKHDVSYVTENIEMGLPGLEREVHDTLWNIEHITKRHAASDLLRGVIGFGALYLIIGSALKYNMDGARGLDMLPHIGFWMEYPKLVMDGVAYSKMIVLTYMGQPHSVSFHGSGGFQEIGAGGDGFSA